MEQEIQSFSLGRACRTCRYWESNVKTDIKDGGECRYSPPAFSGSPKTVWPATFPDDWCRCWKSDAETPTRKPGRPIEHKPEILLPLISEALYRYEGAGRVELYKEVYAVRQLSFSTFVKILDALVALGEVECYGNLWWVKGQKQAMEAGTGSPAEEEAP